MKYFRHITNHSKLNIHLIDFDVIILWYSQAAALPPKFCKFSSKFLGLHGWGNQAICEEVLDQLQPALENEDN